MKKQLLLLVLAAVFILPLAAQNSDVVYLEGWVDVKTGSGDIYELFMGDEVRVGETVITGDDGLAELQPESGSRIIIHPGTVFSLQERTVNGQKRSVVSTALGSVAFRFNKMTGAEPDIATPSMVAGIRGTEFTVFAGADGSSLIVVESGAVAVESQGRSVELAPNEGVEVQPGEAPGEKFQVMRGSLDFTAWNANRAEEMLADPLLALARMEIQLAELAEQVQEWGGRYEANIKLVEQKRAEMRALAEAGKEEEARSLFSEQLRPLEVETSDLVLNYRYYSLHFSGAAVDYQDFRAAYAGLLDYYEEMVVPRLVAADF